MPVKNIIFDFGDVFINLDKPATVQQMKAYGFTVLDAEMELVNQQYEMGLMSSADFISFYASRFPSASKEQLIKAWNAILLDFPQYRLDFLEQLSQSGQYRLFLWSNTNELHLNEVQEIMGIEMYNSFLNCFEKYYFSHLLGMRKPQPECFLKVIEEHQITPAETLFVDDTKEHTLSAASVGLQVWHLVPGKDDVINLFKTNILK